MNYQKPPNFPVNLVYLYSSLLKPELDAGWLELMCRVVSDAFPSPQIKILTSGFSHDYVICGMFADQICDIIDRVRKTGKINDKHILKWMGDLLGNENTPDTR